MTLMVTLPLASCLLTAMTSAVDLVTLATAFLYLYFSLSELLLALIFFMMASLTLWSSKLPLSSPQNITKKRK